MANFDYKLIGSLEDRKSSWLILAAKFFALLMIIFAIVATIANLTSNHFPDDDLENLTDEQKAKYYRLMFKFYDEYSKSPNGIDINAVRKVWFQENQNSIAPYNYDITFDGLINTVTEHNLLENYYVDDSHLTAYLKFHFNESKEAELKATELRLCYKAIYPENDDTKEYYYRCIAIYKLNCFNQGTQCEKQVIIRELVDERTSGCIQFNMLPIATDWWQDPNQNYGFEIAQLSVTANKVERSVLIIEPGDLGEDSNNLNDEWIEKQPWLLSYIWEEDNGKEQDLIRNRNKRSSHLGFYAIMVAKSKIKAEMKRQQEEKEEQNRGKPCRRESMEVNLDRLGFKGKVIAPNRIDLGRCVGDCTWWWAETHQSKDSLILAKLHNVNKKISCCVPTKYTGSSFLLAKNNNDVMYHYHKNLIITECGCV